MSEWQKVKIGDNKIGFKYFPLSFINDHLEKKRQIINTVVFKYIENKYQNVQRLSNLITGTQYGYNASALKNGKNKFLRISDIKDGAVIWETVPFCDCKDEETYKLFKNDILIARTGGTTGKSFLIDSVPKNAIYAGYLIRMRAKETINPHFIYAFLNSYAYWPQISELKSGSAQPNVNAEKLKKLFIPTCPRDIQNEVINFLKTGETDDQGLKDILKNIENIFEASEKQINLFVSQQSHITLLRQQILQDAISGKLTAGWRAKNPDIEPVSALLEKIKAEKEKLIAEKKIKKEKPLPKISEDEVPFKLPERWEWCRLGEIAQHNSGKTLDSGRNKGELREYITTSNLYWDYFDLDKLKRMPIKNDELEKCMAIKGDLLICEGGEAGRSAIWNKDYDICFQNHIHRVRPYCSVSSFYIYYFFQKINLSGEINKYRKGMGISNLSGKSLSLIPIPLPPPAEQKAIVAKIEILMEHVSQLEEKIKQNKQDAEILMQSFLVEAFKN